MNVNGSLKEKIKLKAKFFFCIFVIFLIWGGWHSIMFRWLDGVDEANLKKEKLKLNNKII